MVKWTFSKSTKFSQQLYIQARTFNNLFKIPTGFFYEDSDKEKRTKMYQIMLQKCKNNPTFFIGLARLRLISFNTFRWLNTASVAGIANCGRKVI